MPAERKTIKRFKQSIEDHKVALTVVFVLLVIIAAVYITQRLAIRDSLPPITSGAQEFQIAKLSAEIQQIRSDTQGSLFSLKIIALFVTVGGAVSGYLIGQSQTTKKKIDFEKKKNIDTAYQSIVAELADESPLLRAAAAVKLGAILKSFPTEWSGDEANEEDQKRKSQLIQLTKQVLAAALAIEDNKKVLKTLTIALVLHKPWENNSEDPEKQKYADVRELDLSRAMASDAYWKRVDFSGSDFWGADLTKASFRESVLQDVQFAPANLQKAVFIKAICRRTNFKTADLRGADLTEATCEGASFELADLRNAKLTNAKLAGAAFAGARVFGCELTGATWGDRTGADPDTLVNIAEADDGLATIKLREWVALHNK